MTAICVRFLRVMTLALGLALAFALAAPTVALAKYAAIIVDAGTGEVMFSRNAETRNYPASLTKMMTLYMVFEALDSGRLSPDQRLPVSAKAARQPPSKLGLKRGDSVRVSDAIPALIVKSANDVAVVIAEALAGDERTFAQVMTKRARDLGMRNTTFRNASGLPNRGQMSTARDMATLALALIQKYPHHYTSFSQRKFKWGKRTYRNHNKLLGNYAGTDGLKTGYIHASGFNLVTSVKRGERRLVGVVFGGRTGRSRDRHMRKLLNDAWLRLDRDLLLAAAPLRRPPLPAGSVEIARAPAPKAVAPKQTRPALVSATPAARPPVPSRDRAAPAATDRPVWGVQVGAFRAFSPAHRAVTQAAGAAPDLLLRTRVDIAKVRHSGRTLYRARLVGLEEARARRACQALKRLALDCIVVGPGDGVNLASLPN